MNGTLESSEFSNIFKSSLAYELFTFDHFKIETLLNSEFY